MRHDTHPDRDASLDNYWPTIYEAVDRPRMGYRPARGLE